ncbi:MAG: 3-methyl-2-oxobutanoate hydroxymethyltransferase [Leptospiraceae bacterium]|nr:MAG: 3-methyl-2-oxobutanoate hydroxymethyltransferase [Leptospiraceae bacterium]
MSVKSLKYPQDWIERKKQKQLISIITCYDYMMAKWIARTEIDAILVGDSLGMVIQGNQSTLPVQIDDIIYHTKIVRKGAPDKFLIADMPFGSYQSDITEGLKNSFRIIKETNCQALKFEGADQHTLQIIERIVKSGFPVMGHIGLTPQSFMMMGGFRIQGKEEKQKQILLEQAKKLESVGCFSIVLELVEKELAKEISKNLTIPTIGIGSGNETDGQVLVIQDLLGMDPDFIPKHAKVYANFSALGIEALRNYDIEVKQKKFP